MTEGLLEHHLKTQIADLTRRISELESIARERDRYREVLCDVRDFAAKDAPPAKDGTGPEPEPWWSFWVMANTALAHGAADSAPTPAPEAVVRCVCGEHVAYRKEFPDRAGGSVHRLDGPCHVDPDPPSFPDASEMCECACHDGLIGHSGTCCVMSMVRRPADKSSDDYIERLENLVDVVSVVLTQWGTADANQALIDAYEAVADKAETE